MLPSSLRMLPRPGKQWLIWLMKFPSFVWYVHGRHLLTFWVGKTSSSKPPLKNIVRHISVSRISPFHVTKQQCFFLRIFLLEIVQNLSFLVDLSPGRLSWKSGDLFLIEAAPGVYRFKTHQKQAFHPSPTGPPARVFMSRLLMPFGRIVLLPANCNDGKKIKRNNNG